MGWIFFPLVFALGLCLGFGLSLLGVSLQKKIRMSQGEISFRLALPGHDCGLCGYEDCKAYARVLEKSGGDPGRCRPGGNAVEGRLREIRSEPAGSKQVAIVKCGAGNLDCDSIFEYQGANDCRSALSVYGGPKACRDACIGLGSCVVACPQGAITTKIGLATIDPLRCTGCGYCVSICPTRSIALIRREAAWYVACNSLQPEEVKNNYCRVSCTGCGDCVRRSDAWQFSIRDNLAFFSGQVGDLGSKSEILNSLAAICPTGAIRSPVPRKFRSPLPEAQGRDYTANKMSQG